MPRVLAAFLTGTTISAIVLITFVIRRDVNGAIVQPPEIVAVPSISAAPATTPRSSEIEVASPSGAPKSAPSFPGPEVAPDSNLRITPSPAPPEVTESTTPPVTRFPESSDDSNSAPATTPSPLASELPAKSIPAISRPRSEIGPSPAPLIRADDRKPSVRSFHLAVRPTPVSLRPPSGPSRPPACAQSPRH
jgi:hypothetical protein